MPTLFINTKFKLKIAIAFLWILHPNDCFGRTGKIIFEKFEVQTNQKTLNYDLSKKIIVSPQPNNISIYFIDSEKSTQDEFEIILRVQLSIVYKFRVKSHNSINFSNLYGGHYQLSIKNLKTKNQGELSFEILPIFWENWWFTPLIMLLIAVFIGFILYLFFLFRLRQQLRTQLIRDSIARDLHDDIGSYLSSISILSQNVENLIQNNPEKARQSLQKIGNTARQVMDTMSDIVWSINPNQDSMEQIIGRMKDFSNELFFNQDLEINFQISENIKKINLTLEKRRDFFLIFKEAFNNIYKYADATSIEVSIKIIENQIVMKITDDGNGFDKSKLTTNRTTGGNGLKNMQSRAEKLNGKLEIESQIGEGTSIKLSFVT